MDRINTIVYLAILVVVTAMNWEVFWQYLLIGWALNIPFIIFLEMGYRKEQKTLAH